MNSYNPHFFIEQVRGTVIGDYSRKVSLVAPNGNVQCTDHIGMDECPKTWARAKREELLSRPCGDGKPLSYHKSIAESIYGKGEWDVRVWD